MASASAVEWTATVLMPISWQARWMRSAISPRFAISSFSMAMGCAALFDDDQRLVIFDRLAVIDQHGLDRAGMGRGDGVHDLHGFDDQHGVARLHGRTDGGIGRSARFGGEIGDRKSTR